MHDIIEQGGDVNVVGENGITAAHIAAFMGHIEVWQSTLISSVSVGSILILI